jgi:hypothetical protein
MIGIEGSSDNHGGVVVVVVMVEFEDWRLYSDIVVVNAMVEPKLSIGFVQRIDGRWMGSS